MIKSIRKTIRFDGNEYAKISKILEAEKVSFSEVGRASLLDFEIQSKSDLILVAEISKIGDSLKEISKYLNLEEKIDIQILSELVEIEKILGKLL